MAMANVHYLITQPSWMMNTNTRAAAATISLEKLNYNAVIFSQKYIIYKGETIEIMHRISHCCNSAYFVVIFRTNY